MTIFASPLFLQDDSDLPAFVAAEPVRAHIAELSKAGIGYRRVADLAGLTVEVVRGIAIGRRGQLPTRIARERANRILAIDTNEQLFTLVPALGSRRRVQALVAAGWSQRHLADRLGIARNNLPRLLEQDTMRLQTHTSIVELFNMLWDVQPPMATPAEVTTVHRTKLHAARRGWVPALAWDDIDHDPTPAELDNTVAFDDVAVDLACLGYDVHLNPLERLSAIRVLNGQHLSDRDIAARLGIHDRVILRNRKRYDLPAAHDFAGNRVFE